MEGAPLGQIGIVAIGHNRTCKHIAGLHRQLGSHALRRCQLSLAPKGH